MAQLPSVVLKDPSSALTATFVPSAGMVCTSLSDGGVELLGQRRGLRAYLTTGKTMGIPILYPWANRLSANGYAVDGGAVTLTPGVGGVRSDEHGLVIHGVLAAYPGWLVTEQEESRSRLRRPAASALQLPVSACGDPRHHAGRPGAVD
jgi:galactose mutarotase-like enzyme